MKLTSILPYFGGKRTMAPRIVAELGSPSAYWEPFCGSLAVLIEKPPGPQETVCDLHGDVTNLAMVLASDHHGQLYEQCRRMLYSDVLFKHLRKRFSEWEAPPADDPTEVGDAHVERAAVFMAVSWIGRNGVSGTKRINYQMALRYTPSGGGGAQRWTNAVESIPFWHERLRNVVILRRDAFEILPKIEDAAEVALYADPPYLMETRGRGGSRYEHEFAERDHERLAEQLARFTQARVVVSYYADPRLSQWYPPDRWTHIDCTTQKNLHVQNRRGVGRCEAPEVLIVNGPSFSQEPNHGLFQSEATR